MKGGREGVLSSFSLPEIMIFGCFFGGCFWGVLGGLGVFFVDISVLRWSRDEFLRKKKQ